MKTPPNEYFRFRCTADLRCGVGLAGRMDEILAECGITEPVVLVDPVVWATEEAGPLKAALERSGRHLVVECPAGEPEFVNLEMLRDRARSFGPRAVMGVGGGSVIDMGKALSIVINNPGPCADYQGYELYTEPGIPNVAVPTLFGAGAEVTASAVMINRAIGRKGGINGREVVPRLSIVDAALAVGAPLPVKAASALDALVHALEGYVCTIATPVSRMFSLTAAQRLLPALQRLVADPDDLELLQEVALGSFLAAQGLIHSESGICGAISYPLGVHHRVPHGLAGIALPASIRLMDAYGAPSVSVLAKGVCCDSPEVLALTLEKFIADTKLSNFADYGAHTNIDSLAEEINTFRGTLDICPCPVGRDEIIDILQYGCSMNGRQGV